jgi:hypothetical protein
MTDDVDLDKVWTRIAAQVWCRPVSRIERIAGRLLRSPGLARAVLATPSLLWPWLTASAVVLLIAAAVTPGTGSPVLPLVPLLVPAVAAAGVAYAYGPGIDPAFELSRSMAVSDRLVLLARALAIFVLNAVFGLVASGLALVAAHIGVTFSWLLPMMTVSAVALAAATLARSANVGVATGIGAWCITVLASQASTGQPGTAVASPALVLPYLAAGAIGTAIVLYRTRTRREGCHDRPVAAHRIAAEHHVDAAAAARRAAVGGITVRPRA